MDDFWESLDFTIHDNTKEKSIDSETKPSTSEKSIETSLDEKKSLVPDTFQDWYVYQSEHYVVSMCTIVKKTQFISHKYWFLLISRLGKIKLSSLW